MLPNFTFVFLSLQTLLKCGYFQTLHLKVVQGNVLSKMLRSEAGSSVHNSINNKRSLKQLNSAMMSAFAQQNNENQLNGKNNLLTSSSKTLENSSINSSNNNSFNSSMLPSRKRQYEQLIEGLQRKTYEAPAVLEEPVMSVPELVQETRQKPILRRWVNSEMKRRKIDTVSTTEN
jgi:hypothetical protein